MTQTELSSFIWAIADLICGPYRPPQYERVMLPFDDVAPLRLRPGGHQAGSAQEGQAV
jgi:hypothetical protein